MQQDIKDLDDPAYSYLIICDTDAKEEIIAAATWKIESEKSHEAEKKSIPSTTQTAPPGKNMVRYFQLRHSETKILA